MLTNLDFLNTDQPWPPKSEQARIDLYIENEHLRAGEFEQVWPNLNDYLRNGKNNPTLEFTLDYPDHITQKTSDMIIGEPPVFTVQQGDLGDIVDRLNFLDCLDQLIRDTHSLGDGILKAIFNADDKSAELLCIDPIHWFPVVIPGTNRIQYQVLAFQSEKTLEVEIHSPKTIEHRIYELKTSPLGGTKIGTQLNWYDFHQDVKEKEENPIGDFMVVTCHNKKQGIFGTSCYKPSIKRILKKLIIRYSMENDVLDVFTKPTLVGPRNLEDTDPITKKPVFRPGSYKGVNVDPGTTPFVPQAIVWDAHLPDNDLSKKSLLDRLFDLSEMSPVLFASQLAGMAESGTALRLRLTNTLALCSRIRSKVDVAAKKALNMAVMLEGNTIGGLFIEWKDGVPEIPLETAQYYTLMFPILGQKEILRQMDYTDEEIAAIMSDTVGQVPQPNDMTLPGG